MASCVLHNYLMSSLPNYYASLECFDRENFENGSTTSGLTTDSRMESLQRNHLGDAPRTAKQIRDEFMSYFVNERKVPWQENFIH